MGLKKITRVKSQGEPVTSSDAMLRVLYVEDNEANWAITEMSLRDAYQLELATNSDKALELLNIRRFDLILMDIELQGSRLDGIEITRAIRSSALSYASVPIIFVTAYSARYSRSDLIAAGGDDLVEKPVDFPKLQRSMAQLFRAKSQVVEQERAMRVEAEDLLDDKNAELEQAAESLAFVESKLVQADKMALYGTLTASIVHELCSPISAIVASLGPLGDILGTLKQTDQADSSTTKDMVERFDIIYEVLRVSSGRLQEQVDALRRGSRRAKDVLDEVNIEVVLREALLVAGARIKHIPIKVEHTDSLPSVRCVPGQVGQIILNLVVNAADAVEASRRYTDPSIVVRLSGDESDEIFRIEVHDDGPGVPEDMRNEIFEGFFTTKDASRGTGLGLSVCKKIATDHGGELSIEDSKLLRGACFVVKLPVAGPASQPDSSES